MQFIALLRAASETQMSVSKPTDITADDIALIAWVKPASRR